MKKITGILLCLFMLCGCATSHLENGKESVVTFEKDGISAEELYESLKSKAGTDTLITLIDTKLLEKEYGSNDNYDKTIESRYINDVVKSLKGEWKENFDTYAKSYYGVKNEDELKEVIRLTYRRNRWMEDYSKTLVNDTQIDDYYNDVAIGDITASHILISSQVSSSASDEDKKAAEDKAREKALEVINRLNNGEKFEDLAKELSDDESNKNEGGNLGAFNYRNNFDENFMDAAVKLEVGKYTTTPVKSQYGFHIILKTKQEDKPEKDKIKDEIIGQIAKDIAKEEGFNSKAILALREKYGVKITDSELEKEYNKLYGLE